MLCQNYNVNTLTPLNFRYEVPKKVYEQKIYFGIKGGIGASYIESNSISVSGSIPYSELFGSTVANFKTSKRISFRHEMSLVVIKDFSQYSKPSINFAMPWLVNYHFSEVAFVSMGLQPSVLLASQYPTSLEAKEDNNKNLNLAGLVGIDLIFENNINVGFRFVKTFNNYTNSESPNFNGLQVSVAYLFHKLSERDKKLMFVKSRRNKKVPSLASIR